MYVEEQLMKFQYLVSKLITINEKRLRELYSFNTKTFLQDKNLIRP